jgi:hypothetical protein
MGRHPLGNFPRLLGAERVAGYITKLSGGFYMICQRCPSFFWTAYRALPYERLIWEPLKSFGGAFRAIIQTK